MAKETIIDGIVAAAQPAAKPKDTTIVRDTGGRFLKGHSGNYSGQPPGTVSLVRLLKKHLHGHPKDAKAIVDALILMGKQGDIRAIEQIIDRIDGKAVETHKIEGEMPVVIQFVPAQRLIRNEPIEIETSPLLELEEGKRD